MNPWLVRLEAVRDALPKEGKKKLRPISWASLAVLSDLGRTDVSTLVGRLEGSDAAAPSTGTSEKLYTGIRKLLPIRLAWWMRGELPMLEEEATPPAERTVTRDRDDSPRRDWIAKAALAAGVDLSVILAFFDPHHSAFDAGWQSKPDAVILDELKARDHARRHPTVDAEDTLEHRLAQLRIALADEPADVLEEELAHARAKWAKEHPETTPPTEGKTSGSSAAPRKRVDVPAKRPTKKRP